MSTPTTITDALSDPSVQGSAPDTLIPNIMNALNIADLEPVSEEESALARATYFQVECLTIDGWTKMPGIDGEGQHVQIFNFKLSSVPESTHVVVDVMIDKTIFEKECFDKFISNIIVEGKSIIFYALGVLPVDITVGFKCTTDDGTVVLPTEENFAKRKAPYFA